MAESVADPARRNWVMITCGVGAVGGVATAVPFVASFAPSERAKAAGAPVEADVSGLKPGEKMVVEWRGKPVWILRRTPEQLASLKKTDAMVADPQSQRTQYPTPTYAKNEWRSIKPEYFIAVGICSHLGCSPSDKFVPGAQPSLPDDWPGGFLCPCHGSTFDLAGRVFQGSPASVNLRIPPYSFQGDNKLVIGVDAAPEKGAA